MPADANRPPRTETRIIRTRARASQHREQVTPIYICLLYTSRCV